MALDLQVLWFAPTKNGGAFARTATQYDKAVSYHPPPANASRYTTKIQKKIKGPDGFYKAKRKEKRGNISPKIPKSLDRVRNRRRSLRRLRLFGKINVSGANPPRHTPRKPADTRKENRLSGCASEPRWR